MVSQEPCQMENTAVAVAQTRDGRGDLCLVSPEPEPVSLSQYESLLDTYQTIISSSLLTIVYIINGRYKSSKASTVF